MLAAWYNASSFTAYPLIGIAISQREDPTGALKSITLLLGERGQALHSSDLRFIDTTKIIDVWLQQR